MFFTFIYGLKPFVHLTLSELYYLLPFNLLSYNVLFLLLYNVLKPFLPLTSI